VSDPRGGADKISQEGVPLVPAYVERRETCPRYVFGGGVWIVLADARQTAGNIANIESIYQSGGGLPRLIHEREAEMAYVISGLLRVRIGDDAETTAGPGAMVFAPRGVSHRFTAALDDTRVYHGFVPAGFERLLVESSPTTESMIVAVGEAPFDPAAAATYGVRVVPE
jgi:quercetin dioxygenase-like cupin family protein